MFKNKISFYQAVIYLVLFTTLSGAIRKWGGVSNLLDNIVLIIQLVSPFIYFFILKKQENRQTGAWLAIYFFCLLICAINPIQLTWYHSLFGLIIHLGFYVLMFGYLLSDQQINEKYWNEVFITLGIIEIILASLQYVSASDAWINRFAVSNNSEATNTAYIGDAIRATGTFSYIAGYTSFLVFFMFFLLYRLKVYKNNPWNLIFLIFGFYGSLLSGSRGMMVIYVATVLMFSITELKIKNGKQIIRSIGFTIIFLLINALFGDPASLNSRFEKSWNNFYDRWTNNSSEGQKRIFLDFNNIASNNFKHDFTGIGLGATYQGSVSKWGKSPYLNDIYYEGELFRLFIEGGYLLLFLRFVLIAFILSKLHFSNLFKIYLFIIIAFYSALVFNIYNAVYVACGIIVLDTAYRREKLK